jgi:uncharacterized membrane protein HdeD (DUF308 family)
MTNAPTTPSITPPSSGWTTVLGILLVVLGFLSLVTPLVSGITVAVVVGALVLAGGIVHGVYAFRAASLGRGVLKFVIGAVTAVCGMLMLVHPLLGLASLTLFLAAYFVVEGVSRIFFALELRPLKGWGWTLFGGILSLILGVLIWSQWPLSGAWAIGVLFGVNLMMGGWTLIALGTAVAASRTSAPTSDATA